MVREDVQTWILSKLVEVSDGRIPMAAMEAGTQLRRDLGLTSLLAVNLVLDVEDQFGIEVTDAELMHLGTVGDIVSLVRTKLEEKAAGTS
jgi:acyl carrier protein